MAQAMAGFPGRITGMDMVAVTADRRLWARVVTLALCVAASPAFAGDRIVYRSELRDGRVLYSDAPAAGAGRVERLAVEPHPADPQQAQAALRALAAQREALLQDGRVRSKRLAQIDAEIATATDELLNARTALVAAQDVGEGDRQGRRLAPAYWQRQQRAADAQARAQRQLNSLMRERAALQ